VIVATGAHRFQQVLAHFRAVGRQWMSQIGVATPVGAEGDAHLSALRATPRARRAFAAAHPADHAASIRTAASLRNLGAHRDDQLAALLHDLAKGTSACSHGCFTCSRGRRSRGGTRAVCRCTADAAPTRCGAPALASKLGAPRGTIAILRELARQESRGTSRLKPVGLGARARLLLDLDSGAAR